MHYCMKNVHCDSILHILNRSKQYVALKFFFLPIRTYNRLDNNIVSNFLKLWLAK